jgi:hypothetical protein
MSYLLHFLRLLAQTFHKHNHFTRHDTYKPTHAFPCSRAQSFTYIQALGYCIMVLTSFYGRVHKTSRPIFVTDTPIHYSRKQNISFRSEIKLVILLSASKGSGFGVDTFDLQ